ncbi:hypothetical protein PV08_02238 [Exophiala spinifera]|uniref:FAD-binding domain-containing protein n=1 Tax=Exophiala spinifera TaxID=91928 RepID=A0A0D2BRG0_9EURO|nr:uncharacterized protein PV08_02238 [Exophiala spinifera]KIW21658.1 hypothetical protein PV08_02238 [Exophiala spinifera]
MACLRVLIVGAGISGNALAYWLAKQKHTVTVIERHHCLRVNGLQLDLRGLGIEVMKLMGLEEAVRAKCVPEEGMGLVDPTGRKRAFFPANRSGAGAQSITSEFEIMRGDLCQLLTVAAVSKGVKYRFSTGVEAYMEKGSTVEVRLTDGSTQEVDLLVGCDGNASKVRRLMSGGGSLRGGEQDPALVMLPEKIAYYTMDEPMQKNEKYEAWGCVFPGPGKRVMATRRHNSDRIQMYLFVKDPSNGPLSNVKRGDTQEEKAAFIKLFRGCGWRAADAVRALETAAEDFYCQHTGVVKLDSWSRGHVTLVGDAGYGCPPDGFGTSMALVGAYVLAGEINRAQDTKAGGRDMLAVALKAYEETFGPCMKPIVKTYSAQASIFDRIPWTPFTLGLVTNALSIASYLRLDKLALKLMPNERGGWKLPRYEGLINP